MIRYGAIHEFYDDEHEFPVDGYTYGIVYILNSVADHLYRNKVMYHAAVLKKKR